MDEIWRDIDGYNGWYQVSNKGNFRSWNLYGFNKRRDKARELGKFLTNSGYYIVHLRNSNGHKSCLTHRIVAKAFIPNPEKKKYINHKNGIKTDNRVENLEWCTCQENVDHAVDNNLHSVGSDVGTSKLDEEKVRQIKKLLKTDLVAREIAEMFNVCRSTIKEINRGATWKHVELK